MPWKWELPDWPHFSWEQEPLAGMEANFQRQAGVIIGVTSHLPPEEESHLTIELISSEAMDTSSIEGESLDRESVQASVRHHLGLTAERKANPAEAGVARMMVDLYRHDPLGDLREARLLDWHALVMAGRWDLDAVGRYRFHEAPMEIVSGSLGRERVHYVAPPSARLESEMSRFLQWFNASAPGGETPLPAIVRAGIAHLWFECLHPFEDGNGRIGRAIIEKALAQGVCQPIFTGISGALLRQRKAYYKALALTNRTLAADEWLRWFAGVVLDAQRRTLAQVEFVLAKQRLLARAEQQMNARQLKAIHRMFREGVEGFTGGLSAGNYQRITNSPPATASRDLAALVELQVLRRTGRGKGTRYYLALPSSDERSPSNSQS